MVNHILKISSVQRFGVSLPVATVVLIEIVRLTLVHQFYAHDQAGAVFFIAMTLKHDAAIVGAIVLLQLVGATSRRPFSDVARLASWCVMLLAVIDLFVFAQFSRRLRLSDLVLYGAEGHAISDVLLGFIRDIRNLPLVAAGVCALAGLLLVWVKPIRPCRRSTVASGMAGVALLGCSSMPDHVSYNNAWAYSNIAEIQLMNGVLKPYSAEAVDAARQWSEARDAAVQCQPGLASQRDVTLVLWESLSSHLSQYLSGLADWTPEFDALARQHHVWTNFYANGNNTAWGYVASLTGHDPLLALNGKNFRRWEGVSDALPYRVKAAGYTTAFLTTGDNSFLEVGAWMKSIGFDHVEGHDAPFYDGMERFNFRAASDGALYNRSLQWMQQTKKPFVLVLKTVSTHQPYIDPLTHERSEEAAFRYADRAFGQYVRDLTAQGYFARGGVLMVTGDHRDMVPLGSDETARFGQAADSMIPLLVIGKDLSIDRQISAPFQQADITPSIEYLASKNACFSPRQRNLFQPLAQASASAAGEPRCILHMRGDEYDEVDVFCGQQNGTVQLDGDKTQVTSGVVPNGKALIDEINAERIGWFLRRKPDGRTVRELPLATDG